MNKKKKMMKIETPRIPSELPVTMRQDIQSNDFLEMEMIQDCEIENSKANKVIFDKIIFRNVTFTETAFTSAELTDVIFEKCDLSNVDFSDAVIHRTEFKDCKMIGINLSGTTLRNILFDNCLADYAAFRFANIKQVIIQDSFLSKADFSYCKLQKFEFSRCTIDQVQFSGTELNGIDLSDCSFSGLGVFVENLKGCIISREQAYIFANLFGLIINE